MKLFQQLLVAPAALGLMAPIAANAADLNLNEVSNYSASGEQVQSISQFSDVYPTDWAYQALVDLAKRHGCNAATPSGSITRYEAAALLNTCLGNVAQTNEEERRLINEFAPELAVIKGRVDGLETGVTEFEAGVFSTTTKLSGQTVFVIGALDTGSGTREALNFTYDTKFSLDTSFTGRDRLKTLIRSGNIGNDFSSYTALETAYDSSNALKIERSYYQFPIGDEFTATIGALVRQDDMLAVWPSSYPSDSILDVLTYAGANAAYSLAEGQGAGITYAKDQLSASLLFVSTEGTDSNPDTGGLMTNGSADDVTLQVAWTGETYTVAAAMTTSDEGEGNGDVSEENFTAFGLSWDWNTGTETSFLPDTVSAGVGFKTLEEENKGHDLQDSNTWSLGLQWNDAWVDGNTLGMGIGSSENWKDHHNGQEQEDPIAAELFYSMAVSDNVTVTPAVFVQEKTGKEGNVGALVKTTFKF